MDALGPRWLPGGRRAGGGIAGLITNRMKSKNARTQATSANSAWFFRLDVVCLCEEAFE